MEFTKQYSAYTVLGFGVIFFHDLDLANVFTKTGPAKLHKFLGKSFCFSYPYFKKTTHKSA